MPKTKRILWATCLLVAGVTKGHAETTTRKVRSYAPLAARELGIYRNARPGAAHGEDTFSRVHSTEDGHYLMHVSAEDFGLHKYAVWIAPRPVRAAAVVPARAEAHFPLGIYPSLTPWVTVHLDQRGETVVTPSPQKAWKARLVPIDDQAITLAVGRRLVFEPGLQNGRGTWVERAVRVQRAFERWYMGQPISITLVPAGPNERFDTVRVDRGSAAGFLKINAQFGEVLGFTGDLGTISILSTNGKAYEYRLVVSGNKITFLLQSTAPVPREQYRAEYRHLEALVRVVTVEKPTSEETEKSSSRSACDDALADETLSSETASD